EAGAGDQIAGDGQQIFGGRTLDDELVRNALSLEPQMQDRPGSEQREGRAAAAKGGAMNIDVGRERGCELNKGGAGDTGLHAHGPGDRDMAVQIVVQRRRGHCQALRSSRARLVMARRLAMVFSVPFQRFAPSGFSIVTSGKRPKLTFIGWKERAPL